MPAQPTRASRPITATRAIFALLSALLSPHLTSAEEPDSLSYEWSSSALPSPSRPETNREPKTSNSLDVTPLTPLSDQLGKLGLRTGYYAFDDGVEDQVVGVKRRDEVSFGNRAFILDEYHGNPSYEERNGFVGIWTSLTLRSPGEGSPESMERLRTSRELPSGPAQLGAAQSTPGASQLFNLFKPKPKANLVPTSGIAPMGGSSVAPPLTAPNLSASNPTLETGSVNTFPSVQSQQDSPLPEPRPQGRFLGIIPVKAPFSSTESRPENRPGLVEQILGKPASRTAGKKNPGRSSTPMFRR